MEFQHELVNYVLVFIRLTQKNIELKLRHIQKHGLSQTCFNVWDKRIGEA